MASGRRLRAVPPQLRSGLGWSGGAVQQRAAEPPDD